MRKTGMWTFLSHIFRLTLEVIWFHSKVLKRKLLSKRGRFTMQGNLDEWDVELDVAEIRWVAARLQSECAELILRIDSRMGTREPLAVERAGNA
jgi:hypothetical protein